MGGKIKVSEKTLHRDIEKINQELELFNVFVEKKAGVGIKINTDQANKKIFFEQIMKQMKIRMKSTIFHGAKIIA